VQRSIRWQDDSVLVVDQRLLPHQLEVLHLYTPAEIVTAIQTLAIRGASTIGIAGALGVALSARQHTGPGAAVAIQADSITLAAARPTAVTLAAGVTRALTKLLDGPDAVLAEALRMLDEDQTINRQIAGRTAQLTRQLCRRRTLRILTHCNTGRFATTAIGTAIGAIKELAATGQLDQVLVTETRPLLQGARLTAWELREAGIPFRLCVDSAAPAAISRGLLDCVIVGADRIAANGDVANKIGTYSLAIAAHRHGLPFIVAATESAIDPQTSSGADITIEERPADEIRQLRGVPICKPDADVFNPAFDVTPNDLITAIVTESRVHPGGRLTVDDALAVAGPA
jgi:methylthioribose-1-phosphate isomerase